MLPGGRGLVRATARRVVLEVEGKWWEVSQPTLRRARKRIKSRCFSKFSRVGATGRCSLRPFCRCNESFLGLFSYAGTPSNHPRRSRAALLTAELRRRHSPASESPGAAASNRYSSTQTSDCPSSVPRSSPVSVPRPLAPPTRRARTRCQCSSPSLSTPSPRGPRTHSTPFRPSGS